MLIDGCISLLTADAGVSELIQARLYENLLPRGYRLPSVVIHQYGGSLDYDYAGPVGVREDQIQFDVYGESAANSRTVKEAIRAVLDEYVGTLPDGTVVQMCALERDMAMPFLSNADARGIANRLLLSYKVVSKR